MDGSTSDRSSGRASFRSSGRASFSGVDPAAAAAAEAASNEGQGKRRSRRVHVVYQLRARVGPFECTSYRRFSDFLKLQHKLRDAAGKEKRARQALAAATPSYAKLRESKLWIAPRAKVVEQRKQLLHRYCAELCAVPEYAQSELVTGFFWPSDGTGSVVAPDGSVGSMTGMDALLALDDD